MFFCNLHVKALQRLWPEDDLMVELEDMLAERESTQGEAAKTVMEALTSRSVRWQILTLVFPCAGVQFCGVTAVCSALSRHTAACLVSTTVSSVQLYFYVFDIFHESGVPENLMQYLALGIGATELTAVTLCVSVSANSQKAALAEYCLVFLFEELNIFCTLLCISVFSNRSHWQKETDGLQLSADGCHHVCTHGHIVTQGEGPSTIEQL